MPYGMAILVAVSNISERAQGLSTSRWSVHDRLPCDPVLAAISFAVTVGAVTVVAVAVYIRTKMCLR